MQLQGKNEADFYKKAMGDGGRFCLLPITFRNEIMNYKEEPFSQCQHTLEQK
ncbi:TPA: hypothetical protein ACX6SK_000102 [Photobacterium damselae]